MIRAAIVVNDFYKNNRLFDIDDPVSNRDDRLYAFFHLKRELAECGIDLSTHDMHSVESSEIVLFSDMPKVIPRKAAGQRFYLLAIESVAVHPINFKVERYKYFDKVFTYKDDIVNGRNIIKINYSYRFKPHYVFDVQGKTRLACLISNNKLSKHPAELYTERIKAIHWFESNCPHEFDLYGAGWDRLHSVNSVDRLKKRIRYGIWVKNSPYGCYKGMVPNKVEILSKYRFNICYENIRDIPGYITEKIFDCFFAGCVPVYWGANNIGEHIPEACFISRTDFAGYDALYDHLKRMNQQEYQQYLDNIRSFLEDGKAYEYSSEYFVKTISREISGLLRKVI